MSILNSEQAKSTPRLELQFFNDGTGSDFDSIPTGDTSGSNTPSGEQVNTDNQNTEESFVDTDLLPEELKNSSAYRGMQKAYTQKTQEIAEFRNALKDAGMSAKEAATFINQMNQDPIGTMNRLSESMGYRLSKAEQQQVAQAAQAAQDAQDQLEIDPDDSYAQQVLKAAEKLIEQRLNPLLKQIDPLLKESQATKEAEAKKFFGEVDQAIAKVIGDYPEAGLTKEQLFETAKRFQILPQEMENALMLAVGREKYLGLVQQKQLRSKANTALENQHAVAPMVSGQPAQNAAARPKNFDEATKNVLNYFNSHK